MTPDELENWHSNEVVKLIDQLQDYLDIASVLLLQDHPDVTKLHIEHCHVLLRELQKIDVNRALVP